jgi:Helitron helicase-like domain at N-terminus
VANNPAAAARFFDFMCHAFIKNVLGVGSKHCGLFGKTSGYYGTVEQQGRLTLHLHLLLWIKNSLSPQEIHSKIMDRDSNFQQQMVQYLESVCKGEFFDGNLNDTSQKVAEAKKNDVNYTNPTKTMPEPLPSQCKKKEHENCEDCLAMTSWWLKFTRTTDDLLLQSMFISVGCQQRIKMEMILEKVALTKKVVVKPNFHVKWLTTQWWIHLLVH